MNANEKFRLRTPEQEDVIQNGTLEHMDTRSIIRLHREKEAHAIAIYRILMLMLEGCERENEYCKCHKEQAPHAGIFHVMELITTPNLIHDLAKSEGVGYEHIDMCVQLVTVAYKARFVKRLGL